MKKYLIALLIVPLLAICGCGHEKLIYVPGPSVHDTVIEHSIISDTVIKRDSIFTDRFIQGDTVYQTTVKDHYIYKSAFKTDTVYRSSVDTMVITNTIPVEKELNTYDSIALKSGRWLLPLFLIIVAFCIGRFVFKLKTGK